MYIKYPYLLMIPTYRRSAANRHKQYSYHHRVYCRCKHFTTSAASDGQTRMPFKDGGES